MPTPEVYIVSTAGTAIGSLAAAHEDTASTNLATWIGGGQGFYRYG